MEANVAVDRYKGLRSLRKGVPLAVKMSDASCRGECKTECCLMQRMMGPQYLLLLLLIVAKVDRLLYFPAALLLLWT